MNLQVVKNYSTGRITRSKSAGKRQVKADEVIKKYTVVTSGKHSSDQGCCCICCEPLISTSAYSATACNAVCELKTCKHLVHKQCLSQMYNSGPQDGSLQCPICKLIYGKKYGVCPPGEMRYWTEKRSLPGYQGCGTIIISYIVYPGIQGDEHPHPGRAFGLQGFPRTSYLPDNDTGRQVLKLLVAAWKRRLTFTVGTSITTGRSDTVTWNEIHHKTQFADQTGHGYPDSGYLDSVTAELAIHGVTEDNVLDHE